MGTYLFERHADDGAGREASASLSDDIARALQQIDWVDRFTVHPGGEEDVIRVDVVFDEEWPDLRASEPGYVATVFHRLGLRTIPNPALADTRADDPLGASPPSDDDPESMDLFLFEE
jgi:hypothetical protein